MIFKYNLQAINVSGRGRSVSALDLKNFFGQRKANRSLIDQGTLCEYGLEHQM